MKPKKAPSLETVKQNIFNAKTEKEKNMWKLVLAKLEGKK